MGFMDCDSHVLEVPETWDFLDPKEEHFRPQIARFEDGAAIRLGARAQNEGLPRTPSQLFFAGDSWTRFVPCARGDVAAREHVRAGDAGPDRPGGADRGAGRAGHRRAGAVLHLLHRDGAGQPAGGGGAGAQLQPVGRGAPGRVHRPAAVGAAAAGAAAGAGVRGAGVRREPRRGRGAPARGGARHVLVRPVLLPAV